MSSLNDIILIITKEKVTCFEAEPCIHQNVEDKIKFYDDLLEKLTIPRAKINELKEKKDNLVKQYINETKAPKSLDIELLNYKALLFYFKDNFIKKPLTLRLTDYQTNGKLQNDFANFFFDGQIKINKVKWVGFPHLIGIKDVNIDKFLDGIFYEMNLLEDYKTHKGDVHKIKTFSWVIETLRNPTYVFDIKGIKAKHFKSDLVFIRKITGNCDNPKYYWHIVGLGKEVGGTENEFFIRSQFPMQSEKELYRKFDKNKNIYKKKWKA